MAEPWRVVDHEQTADGLLELRARGESEFLITIDGRILMNSVASRSEEALAQIACRRIGARRRPRMLIGGLGMGCTLRAALAALPASSSVVVAELNPVIVKWCRNELTADLREILASPRVTVLVDDVARVISGSVTKGWRFDAILLDLYEGPTRGGEDFDPIFGRYALEATQAALEPGGLLAIWSEDRSAGFDRRLRAAGYEVEVERVPGGGSRHVIYLATIGQPNEERPGRPRPGRGSKRRRGAKKRY